MNGMLFVTCHRQRLEDFMSGFGVITLKLKEMYQMITLGGDAELELVDSLDPFSGMGNLWPCSVPLWCFVVMHYAYEQRALYFLCVHRRNPGRTYQTYRV